MDDSPRPIKSRAGLAGISRELGEEELRNPAVGQLLLANADELEERLARAEHEVERLRAEERAAIALRVELAMVKAHATQEREGRRRLQVMLQVVSALGGVLLGVTPGAAVAWQFWILGLVGVVLVATPLLMLVLDARRGGA